MNDHADPLLHPNAFHLTDIRHGTPEWHERRRTMLTATDVPAILGESKWKTPLRIWSRIILDSREGERETSFLRWGNALEPIAAAEFERETGAIVHRSDRLAVHPRLPWLGATPDAFAVDPFTGEVSLVEFKAPGIHAMHDWEEGSAPLFYVLQVQAQLVVTGLERGVLCALIPPTNADSPLVVTCEVRLTPQRRAEIEATLEAWWQRHIVDQEQPDAIMLDGDLLRRMHPDDEPRTLLLEGRFLEAARRMVRLQEVADRMERRTGDMRALLMQHMEGAAWATDLDQSIVVQWRRDSRGARSFRRLKALPKGAPHPVTHD